MKTSLFIKVIAMLGLSSNPGVTPKNIRSKIQTSELDDVAKLQLFRMTQPNYLHYNNPYRGKNMAQRRRLSGAFACM